MGCCLRRQDGLDPEQTTLQQAYDNSGLADPQIQLSAANGPVRLRGEATVANVLELQDELGNDEFVFSRLGDFSALADSPTITFGSGSGGPIVDYDKTDAFTAFVSRYQVASVTRWSQLFSPSEDVNWQRHDGGGVVIDVPFSMFVATGEIQLRNDVTIGGGAGGAGAAVDLINPNVVVTMGDGTGAPTNRLDKGAGSNANMMELQVAGTNMWIAQFLSDEDIALLRRDAGGLPLDTPIRIDWGGGDITLANDLILDGSGVAGTGNLTLSATSARALVGASTFPSGGADPGIYLQGNAGAFRGASSGTDATTKTVRLESPHFTNTEEPFGVIAGTSSGAADPATISIGGGSSISNAATDVNVYAAATSTTLGNAATLMIDIDVAAVRFPDGTIELGDDSGSPVSDYNKTAAGTTSLRFFSSTTQRFSMVQDSSEDWLMRQHDGAGAVTFTTSWTNSTGRWIFPADVRVDGILTAGDGASGATLRINGTGAQSDLAFQDAGVNAWILSYPHGSDAFEINRRNPATGANVDNALVVASATGLVTIQNDLTVTGTGADGTGAVTIADDLSIGGATAATADVIRGVGGSGQLLIYDIDTDSIAPKLGRWGTRPFVNAQVPFFYLSGRAETAANNLSIGGGTSLGQAATRISLYTAAAVNTTTGTERLRLDSSGNLLAMTTNNLGASGNRFGDLFLSGAIDHTGATVGFFSATPVAQPTAVGITAGFTAGVGTGVNDDSTFTGNTGASAYTLGDVVRALKDEGLIAA